ncbi:MAG: FAD-dependent tricarballylate dehydrogenase TcuA [Gemmatimonadota bacterium]
MLVVGGGNAALCAALSARASGARVLMLEAAPKVFRGGNSRHTRNLRYVHDAPTQVLSGPYTESEFLDDLLRVTGGRTDETLARLTLSRSRDLGVWMERHGARFQAPLKGSLQLSRTNAFFLGGGKALLNAYYHTATAMGVQVRYEAEVTGLEVEDGRFRAALTSGANGTERIEAHTLVAASGGFQANEEWLRRAWGPAADNFVIRGSPYDRGRVLEALLDHGAATIGDPTQCHAVAVDARAPRFDGGIVTRLDCVPFGIAVNREGRRFYDEGEDVWPKRYAIWGRLVAQQPDQIAYGIIDDQTRGLTMPSAFPPIEAATIPDLAAALGLPVDRLQQTVAAYNRAIVPGTFDPSKLDDCRTEALDPPKSHWALPLDRPPFRAWPLRPGITFTYMGVRVGADARVILEDGHALPNVFAAGEIMSGNVLGQGYLAGFGMTLGTVFGRIAGEEAARHVRG